MQELPVGQGEMIALRGFGFNNKPPETHELSPEVCVKKLYQGYSLLSHQQGTGQFGMQAAQAFGEVHVEGQQQNAT